MATEEAFTLTGKGFMELCYDRKWDDMIKFLSTEGIPMQEKKNIILFTDAIGNTPAHYACRSGAGAGAPHELMKEFISIGGTDMLMKKDKYGRTPLHDACIHGAPLTLIKALTAKGACGKAIVNLQDTHDGSSALHLACENIPKHGDSIVEVAKKLVSIGGEELLSTLNESGKTAYDIAIHEISSEELQKIIKPRGSGCRCF